MLSVHSQLMVQHIISHSSPEKPSMEPSHHQDKGGPVCWAPLGSWAEIRPLGSGWLIDLNPNPGFQYVFCKATLGATPGKSIRCTVSLTVDVLQINVSAKQQVISKGHKPLNKRFTNLQSWLENIWLYECYICECWGYGNEWGIPIHAGTSSSYPKCPGWSWMYRPVLLFHASCMGALPHRSHAHHQPHENAAVPKPHLANLRNKFKSSVIVIRPTCSPPIPCSRQHSILSLQ